MKNWQKIYYFIDWVHNNIVHSASALCMCSSVHSCISIYIFVVTNKCNWDKKNASVKRRKLRSNDKSAAYQNNNNSSVINKLIWWPGRATFFECYIRWVPIHRVWDFNLKLKLTQQIIKWVNWNYSLCMFLWLCRLEILLH